MKATKTWQEMLAESLKDPRFRKEWEAANAELAPLDRAIAAGTGASPAQAPEADRKETARAAAPDSKSDPRQNGLPGAR